MKGTTIKDILDKYNSSVKYCKECGSSIVTMERTGGKNCLGTYYFCHNCQKPVDITTNINAHSAVKSREELIRFIKSEKQKSFEKGYTKCLKEVKERFSGGFLVALKDGKLKLQEPELDAWVKEKLDKTI